MIQAAQVFNVPKEVDFGTGKIYKLHDLDGNDMAEFEAWGNGVLLGQFEQLWKTLGPLLQMAQPKTPGDTGAIAVIEALKYMKRLAADRTRVYFQIGSDEMNQLMLAWIGARELLYLSIKHGEPAFTREDAFALFAQCSSDFIVRIPEYTGLTRPVGDTIPRPKEESPSIPGETSPSTDGAPAEGSTLSS